MAALTWKTRSYDGIDDCRCMDAWIRLRESSQSVIVGKWRRILRRIGFYLFTCLLNFIESDQSTCRSSEAILHSNISTFRWDDGVFCGSFAGRKWMKGVLGYRPDHQITCLGMGFEVAWFVLKCHLKNRCTGVWGDTSAIDAPSLSSFLLNSQRKTYYSHLVFTLAEYFCNRKNG